MAPHPNPSQRHNARPTVTAAERVHQHSGHQDTDLVVYYLH